jgi:bacterioferritin-associated ferredoxin
MSTFTTIAGLRARHGGATTCEPGKCDACTALELLDKARESLAELQERNSKGQYDQAGFAATIRDGMGTGPRG